MTDLKCGYVAYAEYCGLDKDKLGFNIKYHADPKDSVFLKFTVKGASDKAMEFFEKNIRYNLADNNSDRTFIICDSCKPIFIIQLEHFKNQGNISSYSEESIKQE